MTATFSWVEVVALALGAVSLAVTIGIYMLGRRLSFRQQLERARSLEATARKILARIRVDGASSKIILMNASRYEAGYDGSNVTNFLGSAFEGVELLELDHGGIQVIAGFSPTHLNARGERVVGKPDAEANVIQSGHIPWAWIEHINPDGDEFDGSPIFFVRMKAPGRRPYDFVTYRELNSVKFGPNNRDYFPSVPELGKRTPKFFADWYAFLDSWRFERRSDERVRRNLPADGRIARASRGERNES